MTNEIARELLIRGAHALAHERTPQASLTGLLRATAEAFDAGSGAVVAVDREPGTSLRIVATFELEGPAFAGLTEAIRSPDHPIARTVVVAVTTIDVRPMAPGGPALRSHVPLTRTRDGVTTVTGVLALAHEQPLGPDAVELLEAAADLAAVALEAATTSNT